MAVASAGAPRPHVAAPGRADAELVDAVLDGDRAAFAALVGRWERAVMAAVLDVLGCPHGARDAAQDAFVRAFERLGDLRDPAAFGGWLLAIARRCAIDAARKKGRETPVEPGTIDVPYEPGHWLDRQNHEVLGAVARLPESERQVVSLRYFGDHSVKDVAAMLKLSVGTITKQLSRAHRRLREILEGK